MYLCVFMCQFNFWEEDVFTSVLKARWNGAYANLGRD